jgi:hypothetical protein
MSLQKCGGISRLYRSPCFLHYKAKKWNPKGRNGKDGGRRADKVGRAAVSTGTANRRAIEHGVVILVDGTFSTILTIPSD